MKKGGGKGKGGNYERDTCRALSKWIEADEVVFWRSASSGARTTQLAKKGETASNMGGDLVAIGDEGAWLTNYFSIECKSYADFQFDHFFTAKPSKSNIVGWWEQACSDAKRDGKRPCMIFKKNRSPSYIAFSLEDFNSKIRIVQNGYGGTMIRIGSGQTGLAFEPIYITKLDGFFECTDFKALKRILK